MLSLEVTLPKKPGSRHSQPTEEPKGPGAASLIQGHQLVAWVEGGKVRDFAEAARRLGVSQARVSQLVALTFLAPDLQLELLRGDARVRHLTIHHLLLVARQVSWQEQRAFWNNLRRRG